MPVIVKKLLEASVSVSARGKFIASARLSCHYDGSALRDPAAMKSYPPSHRQRQSAVAVGGRGVEIFDAPGKRYIDASGGAAVSCLGHGHPDVIAALHRQLDALAYAHTSFFTTEVAERLADRLIEDAPRALVMSISSAAARRRSRRR